MNNLNQIGLNTQKTAEMVEKLNDLLSNLQIFYMNVRGFHWNIRGEKFFELHQKFEDLYDDLLVKVDEVAERVRILGHTPIHIFSEYIKMAQIKEIENLSDARSCVQSIVDSLKIILEKEHAIMKLSAEMIDDATNAIVSQYISEHDKLVWMYEAFLNA